MIQCEVTNVVKEARSHGCAAHTPHGSCSVWVGVLSTLDADMTQTEPVPSLTVEGTKALFACWDASQGALEYVLCAVFLG